LGCPGSGGSGTGKEVAARIDAIRRCQKAGQLRIAADMKKWLISKEPNGATKVTD
jgi:hypothetical protein